MVGFHIIGIAILILGFWPDYLAWLVWTFWDNCGSPLIGGDGRWVMMMIFGNGIERYIF
jgi:hypothetical protein